MKDPTHLYTFPLDSSYWSIFSSRCNNLIASSHPADVMLYLAGLLSLITKPFFIRVPIELQAVYLQKHD